MSKTAKKFIIILPFIAIVFFLFGWFYLSHKEASGLTFIVIGFIASIAELFIVMFVKSEEKRIKECKELEEMEKLKKEAELKREQEEYNRTHTLLSFELSNIQEKEEYQLTLKKHYHDNEKEPEKRQCDNELLLKTYQKDGSTVVAVAIDGEKVGDIVGNDAIVCEYYMDHYEAIDTLDPDFGYDFNDSGEIYYTCTIWTRFYSENGFKNADEILKEKQMP